MCAVSHSFVRTFQHTFKMFLYSCEGSSHCNRVECIDDDEDADTVHSGNMEVLCRLNSVACVTACCKNFPSERGSIVCSISSVWFEGKGTGSSATTVIHIRMTKVGQAG
jgi:hypothetical protein